MPSPGSGAAPFLDALAGPDGTFPASENFSPDLIYPDPAADLPLPAVPAAGLRRVHATEAVPDPQAVPRRAPGWEPPWQGSPGSTAVTPPRPPVPVGYQRRVAPAGRSPAPARPAGPAIRSAGPAARPAPGRAAGRGSAPRSWILQLTALIAVLVVVAFSSGLFQQIVSAIERLFGR